MICRMSRCDPPLRRSHQIGDGVFEPPTLLRSRRQAHAVRNPAAEIDPSVSQLKFPARPGQSVLGRPRVNVYEIRMRKNFCNVAENFSIFRDTLRKTLGMDLTARRTCLIFEGESRP